MVPGVSLEAVRTALFLPASNPRAIAKARGLEADLVILDLEDAVADEAKNEARDAVVAAAAEDWGGRLLAARINPPRSDWHEADVAALARLEGLDLAVLPKTEDATVARAVGERLGKPMLAMIESPAGIYAARDIAGAVAGLIVGPNDLAASLRLPARSGRAGIALACQMVVLASRAAGVVALDGVYNRLDDPEGFADDCRAGRALGFDGKSVIHPGQIEVANRLFGASPGEVEEARALIEAFTGGAERFRGRMIEAMHVETARRTLARAVASGPD